MVKENTYSKTVHHIKVISIKMIWKAQENLIGKMADNMQDNGKRIRWKVWGNLLGQMAGATSVSLLKKRKRVKEYFNGKMVENMMGNGLMVSSMEEEFLHQQKVKSRLVFGRPESEFDGFMILKYKKKKRNNQANQIYKLDHIFYIQMNFLDFRCFLLR